MIVLLPFRHVTYVRMYYVCVHQRGEYNGLPELDGVHGFIHLSSSDQVRKTAELYYPNKDILVIEVNVAKVKLSLLF